MNCHDLWHDGIQGKEELAMQLTFTLPNGARAGIVPTHGLRELTVEQLGLECLAPAKDVSVVFHVPNQQALDRVRARFGLTEC